MRNATVQVSCFLCQSPASEKKSSSISVARATNKIFGNIWAIGCRGSTLFSAGPRPCSVIACSQHIFLWRPKMDDDEIDFDRSPIPRLKRPRASAQLSDEDSYANGRDIQTHDELVDARHAGREVSKGASHSSMRVAPSKANSKTPGMKSSSPVPLQKSPQNTSNRVQQQRLCDGWILSDLSAPALSLMLRAAGVRGLKIEQLYDLKSQGDGRRTFAILLLHKWRTDRDGTKRWNFTPASSRNQEESSGGGPDDIMFVNQTMSAGSATQAVITAVLNIPQNSDSSVTIGKDLDQLRDMIRPMTPTLRSSAIYNSANVREAHNLASREQVNVLRYMPESDPSDDFWIYSIFMPGESQRWIYELDGFSLDAKIIGFADGSEDIDGDTSEMDDEHNAASTWPRIARSSIDGHIEKLRRYGAPFQLFALVQSELHENGADVNVRSMEKGSTREQDDNGERLAKRGSSSSENEEALSCSIHDEESDCHLHNGFEDDESELRLSRKSYKRDDLARRIATHNYDTFFIEMMKLLASKGDLNRLIKSTATGVAEEASSTSSG